MGKGKKTDIYVGLRDGITHEQRFETTKYVDVLKRVCRNYQVPFSMSLITGGYFHVDGSYVEENSLMLTLLDAEDDTVEQMAKDLCTFFRQESVMVVSAPVSVVYVGSDIAE